MPEKLREVVGNLEFRNLIADIAFPVQTSGIKLKGGQGVLLAGSVIAKDAEGKYILANETPGLKVHSILADDIDTGVADVTAIVYLSGVFNRKKLIFGGTANAATFEEDLRTQGIYLKDVL